MNAPVAKVAADSHACCNEADQKAPVTPESDDPCEKCNARNPQVTMVPEKGTSFASPDVLIAALSPIDLQQLEALVAEPSCASADDLPIPPLLRDLHHTFCQLTL